MYCNKSWSPSINVFSLDFLSKIFLFSTKMWDLPPVMQKSPSGTWSGIDQMKQIFFTAYISFGQEGEYCFYMSLLQMLMIILHIGVRNDVIWL